MTRPRPVHRGRDLRAAYAYCHSLARDHYENFPVASWLLPRRMRSAVAVIYAFARTADDIADEGNLPARIRLQRLDAWQHNLDAAIAGHAGNTPVFLALTDAIQRHALPSAPFYDLLQAFRTDVTTNRYADFAALQAYCRCSANPIGRLLLALFNTDTPRHRDYSDSICTALQLINFLQDMREDCVSRQRIYWPADELTRYHIDADTIAAGSNSTAMQAFVGFQAERAGTLLHEGSPLAAAVPGRMGLELCITIEAGLQVLRRLAAHRGPRLQRTRLGTRDWFSILGRSLFRPRSAV